MQTSYGLSSRRQRKQNWGHLTTFQTGIIFCNILNNLGTRSQKLPSITTSNNTMARGSANNTVKRQRTWSMEMRFFWVGDKHAQEMYDLSWHSGQENLAEYQCKHHPGAHHVAVWPCYLHMENSPQVLPQALVPSNLKGCVGTLEDGYPRKVPLLRTPRIQIPEHVTATAVTCEPHVIYYSQVPRLPTWSDLLARSLKAFNRTTILPSRVM